MDELKRVFGQIGDNFGRVDGWYVAPILLFGRLLTYRSVPAAGVVVDKPFLDHTWEDCERQMKINVRNLLST